MKMLTHPIASQVCGFASGEYTEGKEGTVGEAGDQARNQARKGRQLAPFSVIHLQPDFEHKSSVKRPNVSQRSMILLVTTTTKITAAAPSQSNKKSLGPSG